MRPLNTATSIFGLQMRLRVRGVGGTSIRPNAELSGAKVLVINFVDEAGQDGRFLLRVRQGRSEVVWVGSEGKSSLAVVG